MRSRIVDPLQRSAAPLALSNLAIGLIVALAYGFHLNTAIVVLLCLFVIVLHALAYGFASSGVVSIVAGLSLVYFFVPPVFSFRIGNPHDVQDFLVFLIVSNGLAWLVSKAYGTLRESRQKFVSLANSSLEFIGMYDLHFTPFYVNTAGLRLIGLDDLEAARRTKVQEYFFQEDQPFITNEFFPRVLRDGHGKVEIRFRHFKTGEAIWVIYNVFNIYDSRNATVGWATVSVDITQRRRVELALQESRRDLRALAGRLISAQEEERKRISRELHDDLSQKLALLAFDASGLLAEPAPPAEKMKEQLVTFRARVEQLAQDVRQISHQLHPSVLDDLGLSAALSELCEEFSAKEGIEVVFEPERLPKDLPVDIASCLYRVAQEALHNVFKHARASQARLRMSGSADGIHFSIHDNGIGFDSEAGLSRPGIGVVSMKERVALLHGEYSIKSQPGKGTDISVFVPLSK
jgi:PAS domain S-box-containing protein